MRDLLRCSFLPEGFLSLPKTRRKPDWQQSQGAGSHSPPRRGLRRGQNPTAELRTRGASPGDSWGHHSPAWAPPASPSAEHAAGSEENQPGLISHLLPPEELQLLPLQKSLPTPRLEQKVPAHVEAWKKHSGIWEVLGTHKFPQIPSAELGAGGTRGWGDRGTLCHV